MAAETAVAKSEAMSNRRGKIKCREREKAIWEEKKYPEHWWSINTCICENLMRTMRILINYRQSELFSLGYWNKWAKTSIDVDDGCHQTYNKWLNTIRNGDVLMSELVAVDFFFFLY